MLKKNKKKKKEDQQSSKKSIKCHTCSRTDHATPSRSKHSYHVKSTIEVHQQFTKSSVMKVNLNNTCMDANMILEIQKLVSHIIQAVYTEYMFANHFYLTSYWTRKKS